jgi:arginyl-tRNA synthetase
MQILSNLRALFQAALDGWVPDPAEHAQRVTLARDPKHGDYQANIAMPLQKILGKPPREIAEALVAKLDVSSWCETPEIAGPGFINLRLRNEFLAEQLKSAALDPRCGVGAVVADGQLTFVIDYSGPNVAKPMHVGHIRSTVIGDALTRILRFLGHRVISDNHLGDWGTQFGMIIYGYKHFVDAAAFEEAPVTELSRLYRRVQQIIGYQSATPKLAPAEAAVLQAEAKLVEAQQAVDTDPKQKGRLKGVQKELAAAKESLESLRAKVTAVSQDPQLLRDAELHPRMEQRAQAETVKLHEGDEENLTLWRQFLPLSIQEIDSIYHRLNIDFDHTLGESFYQPMLGGVVSRLQAAGLAVESEGATCLFLDGFDAPMIIRKSDGAFLYATTDLATIDYRMEQFHPDVMLYVVDHRQSDHFAKLFAAARKIGYESVDLRHISFGTVLGSDGKPFKTRSGAVIGLNYLLDEAVERAYQAVCDPTRLQKAGLEMSEEEKREIANVIGLGAIKYADLSHNRTSDYEFNAEKMVQLEGNTSTYIQYMVARARNIMRRSGDSVDEAYVTATILDLREQAERDLTLQLLQFEDALWQSVEDYYPSILAGYLYGLAKQFATFFDQCHVINAESEALKRSRLVLCYHTDRVLRQGLDLLGIGVVDRM